MSGSLKWQVGKAVVGTSRGYTYSMITRQQLRTASRILGKQGPIALLRALRRYLARTWGPYRPDESRIAFEVFESLHTGSVMIDVGAHHGSALAPFARSDWRVFAFEPDANNRKKLIEAFGDLPNLHIDPRAVSDHAAEKAVLFRSELSSGISGLSSFHNSHEAAGQVSVTTLRDFIELQGLEQAEVSFLKIDTEGFDLPVLRGFPWSESAPAMVLCEFENAKTEPLGYKFNDLADFLVDKGYQLVVSEWYPIKQYGGPHDWRRFSQYPCALADPKAWGNIFATHDAKLHEALLRVCKLDVESR